jgi:hypothetical protein
MLGPFLFVETTVAFTNDMDVLEYYLYPQLEELQVHVF